jgi:hypothetical protein
MRPVVAAILLQFADPSTRPGDGLSPQLVAWDAARLFEGRGQWREAGAMRGTSPAYRDRVAGYSPRWNGMKPSRFGIFTWGSVFASSVSFSPITPLRLRM